MNTIAVIPIAEAVAALKAGQIIAKIVPKPASKDGKAKTYQAGTVYFDVKYTIKVPTADGKEVTKTCNGDFSFTDVTTGKPPINRDDLTDERYKYVEDGKEPTYQIQTDTKFGGAFAEFCSLFDPQIEKLIQEAASGPDKIPGFIIKDRKYHHIIQTHIQDEQSENCGNKLENPIVRIKIKPGVYPEKFSRALAGKPQSEFLDGNTKRVVAGKYVYDPCYCVGDDGEPIVGEDGKKIPVTPPTLWHYLVFGSKIEGRINIGSIAINKIWVSLQMTAPRTIIWRGNPGGAVYEDEIAHESDTSTAPKDDDKPVKIDDKVNEFLNDLDKAEDDLE